MFLLRKGASAVVEDIAFHLERERIWTCSKKHCQCLFWTCEGDSGKRRSTLFLSWRNPVYGKSACGLALKALLVRLGDLEGWSIWGHVGELQCQILADQLLQQLASLYQRRDCHQGLRCRWLFQLGGSFRGRLGILQGRLHIHFRQFRHEQT